MAIVVYIIILCLLILDSTTVISGASYGLMLWYKNVVPILLPFMLISSLVVKKTATQKNGRAALLSTIFLGILCGYPIGAKTDDEYVFLGMYEKHTGNIILPLCNNSSPMFISGYIVSNILKNKISFTKTMAIIYFPYILLCVVPLIANIFNSKISAKKLNIEKNDLITENRYSSKNIPASHDSMLECVIQITYVGIYIMICSIIMQFIFKLSLIPYDVRVYISGLLEITRGVDTIYRYAYIPHNIKTALIIALTSFGGVSAILQTNKVISNSGLSIVRYIFMKVLCATISFLIGVLII